MAISRKALGPLAESKYIYIAIVLCFILYFATGSWLFGLLIGLSIVWLVVLECWEGVDSHGIKNELKEIGVALMLALAAYFGAGMLLQTASPINAIVSCSMLPHIQRGDMVVLSGDRIQAPVEQVQSLSGMQNATVYQNGKPLFVVKGSLYSYCAQDPNSSACRRFVSNPSEFTEKKGPLLFGYTKCEISMNGGERQFGPCVEWMEVNGNRYYENLSNDVVVYQPQPDEYYARVGDIIHRAFIRLDSSDGGKYVLTKGDNNPIFDIQVYDEGAQLGNRPVELSRTKGRILVGVPILGYFKLFISPAAIPTPPGCDRHYAKWDN